MVSWWGVRPGRVETTGVADGGEALVEGLLDEGGDAQGEGGEWARRTAVGFSGGEVDVGVHETGEEKAAGGVDDCRLAFGLESARGSDAGDAVVLDEDGNTVTRVGAGAVDEGGVVDEERCHVLRLKPASGKRKSLARWA